jgi:hypothetical protein
MSSEDREMKTSAGYSLEADVSKGPKVVDSDVHSGEAAMQPFFDSAELDECVQAEQKTVG